ncbi:MAG: hypothetical protein RBT11_19660 [Desulfobacterales bacterium]|nr:hypothetical protein [Desulfobacterales bacterium]
MNHIINELLEDFCSVVKIKCDELLRSGAINRPDYAGKEMVLAKIVLTAALRSHADDFAPTHDRQLMSEVKNLEHF